MKILSSFFLLLWTASAFAVAQTSLEVSKDPDPKDLPLWERNAEMALLLTSGNTSVTTLGLGLSGAYRPDRWSLFGKAN